MITTGPTGVLQGMPELADRARVIGIASRTVVGAARAAAQFDIPTVFENLQQMVADPDIDAVVNLTPIPAHLETSRVILRAGKHLITEKPLADSVLGATELIELADLHGKEIVAAPPWMLEPSSLRVKQLVSDGAVGQPAFARVRSSHAGPAAYAWPADPSWFYQAGSGPLLDLGVYGIDLITGILGPAHRVFAAATQITTTRTVAGGPFSGRVIPVTTPDNVIVTLEFANGAVAVVDCTFNVLASRAPLLELYGTAGTIAINRRFASTDLTEGRPIVERFSTDGPVEEGFWVADEGPGFAARQDRIDRLQRASLVEALLDRLDGGVPRLTAAHARHVLEIVSAATTSAEAGVRMNLTTTF